MKPPVSLSRKHFEDVYGFLKELVHNSVDLEAKREEIERKKADAKATEDAEKARLDKEWNEKKKTDAAKVVVQLKEKRRLGQKLTQGETEQLEEALAEEALQARREQETAEEAVQEEKVMATFNDEFLRSM